MIDFLRKCGISDNTIKEMERVNSSANIYNFSCNQDEIVKIIEFLGKLQVHCIEDLLIYRIDLFFVSFSDFKKLFERNDTGNLIQLINDDYTVVDQL